MMVRMAHAAARRWRWPLSSVCWVVVLALAAGACSSGDRASVAAAKCAKPVADKAGFPTSSSPRQDGIQVKELGHGRYRVSGRSEIGGQVAKSVSFTCEVTPDPNDRLRGFKITRLEVTSE